MEYHPEYKDGNVVLLKNGLIGRVYAISHSKAYLNLRYERKDQLDPISSIQIATVHVREVVCVLED